MGNDGAVASRRLCDLAAVASLLLQRAHDGTFRHGSNRQNVANIELRLLSAMDKLSSADTFGADHRFGDPAVLVGVLELNFSEGSASARVMYDVLDETLDKALSLGKVERAQLGGTLSALGPCCENRPSTFTLALDHSPHVYVL